MGTIEEVFVMKTEVINMIKEFAALIQQNQKDLKF
jgi:hypothetical protein